MNNSLKPLQDNLIFSENEFLNFPFSMPESKDNEKGFELFNLINNSYPLPNYFQINFLKQNKLNLLLQKIKRHLLFLKS